MRFPRPDLTLRQAVYDWFATTAAQLDDAINAAEDDPDTDNERPTP